MIYQRFSRCCSRHHAPRAGKRSTGAALVLVLSSLLFVTVLVVAFNMSMRSKMATSKSSSDATGVKLMSETAVNIAVSQLRDATCRAGQKGYAWASQPGMIRLYDDNGAAAGYYKLYSGENMVGTNAFNPFSVQETITSDWSAQPALFTDLNAPASGIYPIVDPAALDANSGAEGVTSSDNAVDEFTVKNPPLASGADSTPNPIPMPVKWLYVLADGSFHLPGSGSTATRAIIPAATNVNPIVGRVAFWADDETCKVNVNTASVAKASTGYTQGSEVPAPYKATDYNTFWDVPRYTTPAEYNFANEQPAQGEYQRYPGHPATVGLNAVFPNLSIDNLFQIAPRYAYDGSKGGTVRFDAAQDHWIDRNTLADRLYASTDELIFSPAFTSERSAQAGLTNDKLQAAKFFLTSNSRAPELNLFGKPRISIWPIDSSITTSSSLRVTTLDRLLAFCSTVSNGSNAQPFYFTRQNPLSTKNDIELTRNQALLNYLDNLTGSKVPGFGGSFKTKYTEPESRQILTEIFDYIRSTNTEDSLLTGANIYAPQQDSWNLAKGQIIPSVHSGWNTQGFGSFWRPIEISILIVGLGDGPLSAQVAGTPKPGIPIPDAQINYKKNGSDSNPTIAHEDTILYGKIDPTSSDSNASKGWMPPTDNRAIQAFLFVSFVNPAQSRIEGSAKFWMKINGIDSLKVSEDLNPASPVFKSLGFPSSATTLVGSAVAGDDLGTGLWFGYLPFLSQIPAGGFARTIRPDAPATNFPFFSKIVSLPIKGNSPTFVFSGGTISIDLYDLSAGPNTQIPNVGDLPSAANKVQTFTVTFPEATLPMPGLSKIPVIGTGTAATLSSRPPTPPTDEWGRIVAFDRWKLGRSQGNIQFDGFNYNYGRTLVDMDGVKDKADRQASDVLQSMVLSQSWSDTRLLATYGVIPPTAYATHPRYGQTAIANSMAMGQGFPFAFHSGVFGKLVSGNKYTEDFKATTSDYKTFSGNPCVTPNENGVSGWDWDTGIGNYGDGPWINKADEGSVAKTIHRPYYQAGQALVTSGSSFFSPNRQVSSPGMFGSLSTGVSRHKGWQTLLFRPGNQGHPGSDTPRDHLLMDLFWMPVVEPYAISEPFSTTGKINLNQQIVPFTYINRLTALRAAMMGEKVAQMPKNQPKAKSGWTDIAQSDITSRLPINLSESNGTLKQFADKFASGEIYKSATEICDVYLVPQGFTWPEFKNQWYGDNFALVGDNVREKPYSNIYGKVTTKSNTFTVHYRAQTLRQTARNLRADPTIFDTASGDKITAEQRGSSLIERYLDSADERFSSTSDPAATFLKTPGTTTGSGFSLESYYRVRVLNSKVFNP